jgi:hypothetical protein
MVSSDLNDRQDLPGQFDDRWGAGPQPPPVHRPHGRRTVIIAVLSGVAVVIGLVFGGYLLVRGPHHGAAPAPGGGSSGPSSAGAGASPPATANGAVRPITLDELAHSVLEVPAWPGQPAGLGWPSGRVAMTGNPTLVPNAAGDSVRIELDKLGYADVDHNGTQDAVVRLRAYIQGGDSQVLAFTRRPDGGVATLGQVVASGTNTPVEAVFDVRAEADGSVSAQVGDIHVCCGVGDDVPLRQWRRYDWTGAGFTQVAGPVTFPPNPRITELAVSTTSLVLGPPVDGVREGRLTVTYRNNGPSPVPDLRLEVNARDQVPLRIVTGPGWDLVEGHPYWATYRAGPLGVGQARTLVVVVRGDAAGDGVAITEKGWVYVHGYLDGKDIFQRGSCASCGRSDFTITRR